MHSHLPGRACLWQCCHVSVSVCVDTVFYLIDADQLNEWMTQNIDDDRHLHQLDPSEHAHVERFISGFLICVWTCLPAVGDLHRQQLAGCYFLTCTAAGTEICRLKSMMLPGPLQRAHSCWGPLLRGVPLPDGGEYLAVCRQTSGKTTGKLGSAWGSFLYRKTSV